MRISTKGIYALEIVADLAMHSTEDSWESLKNIANRRNLSEKYLERIMKGLKDKGIVVSIRGAYGGYCLAKKAEEITAYDVLSAVEDDMMPVSCPGEEREGDRNEGACPVQEVWQQLWERIQKTTEKVTLQDIVDEVEKVSKET
ncbi:MAG: RrF2 family transcriptional regulator [Bariatricus sp.]